MWLQALQRHSGVSSWQTQSVLNPSFSDIIPIHAIYSVLRDHFSVIYSNRFLTCFYFQSCHLLTYTFPRSVNIYSLLSQTKEKYWHSFFCVFCVCIFCCMFVLLIVNTKPDSKPGCTSGAHQNKVQRQQQQPEVKHMFNRPLAAASKSPTREQRERGKD